MFNLLHGTLQSGRYVDVNFDQIQTLSVASVIPPNTAGGWHQLKQIPVSWGFYGKISLIVQTLGLYEMFEE